MKYLLAAALALAPVSAHAVTVAVGYDPSSTANGNFGSPVAAVNTTGYTVTSSQDAERLSVTFRTAGGAEQQNAQAFSNIYFSNGVSSFLGIEVTNNRAFRPGVGGYYDLTGTGFSFAVTGSAAASNLAIDFSLPFSFFRDDPLNMGFARITGAPGNNFLRISLSQTFGYGVAGGATFGNDRLGSFTVPAAVTAGVPEPATWGLMLAGFSLVGGGLRTRRRAVRFAA